MAVMFVTHSVAEAVFLSQRVLVMAARPGRIEAEVAVTAPYPRRPEFRHSAAFTETCRVLGEALSVAHAGPAAAREDPA
jgi:NitT/TauT family transport system ATP-binding protein